MESVFTAPNEDRAPRLSETGKAPDEHECKEIYANVNKFLRPENFFKFLSGFSLRSHGTFPYAFTRSITGNSTDALGASKRLVGSGPRLSCAEYRVIGRKVNWNRFMPNTPCKDKLKMLHALIGVVVRNTKADIDGKRNDTAKEVTATKRLLKSFLGRKPTASEVESVRADTWKEPTNKCCQ